MLVREEPGSKLPDDGHEQRTCAGVRTVRILDFMETSWLSGPAKNLMGFARFAAKPNPFAIRVEVTIVAFHRGKKPFENEFTAACEKEGLRVLTIHERFAFDPAILSAIRRLIAVHKPDILQTHSVKSHFLIRLTGACRQYPWIAFHHGYTWTDLKVLFYNQLDRWSLPASTRVVTVCRPFASALERLGVRKDQIAIQHNAVNAFKPVSEETVSSLRRELGITPDTQVLLNVGRLSREKGQADLVKALAVLRKDGRERKLRLLLVGDGPDRRRLERLASASGLSESITFVGHQFDVAPFYTLADLMVVPSGTEGSPNALLEAMAAGLPIVATAVGGIPEIVSNTNAALLVRKHDHLGLAEAIARLLDNRELREQLSRTARNTAPAYSREAYSNFLLSLYRDCLAESAARGEEASESSVARIDNKVVLTD